MECSLMFRSLLHYFQIEDGGVRGDAHEGSVTLKPAGGLVINNQTQGKSHLISEGASGPGLTPKRSSSFAPAPRQLTNSAIGSRRRPSLKSTKCQRSPETSHKLLILRRTFSQIWAIPANLTLLCTLVEPLSTARAAKFPRSMNDDASRPLKLCGRIQAQLPPARHFSR